jgi:hypothetical protein
VVNVFYLDGILALQIGQFEEYSNLYFVRVPAVKYKSIKADCINGKLLLQTLSTFNLNKPSTWHFILKQ